jgi:divalent metal cation (Fe/Co/Zn/Cd) transporter
MTIGGVRMLCEGVLDLIDHPLRGDDEEAIVRLLLEQGVRAEELVNIRSRRSSRNVFVELTLDPVEGYSFEDTRQHLARVRQGLADHFDGLDASIRLHMPKDY